MAPNEMNKAPQPTGPPPTPSPGIPQVIREELAGPGWGWGRPGSRSGAGFNLWIFLAPSVSGQSATACCQIETGPLAVPGGCHREGVCRLLRLLPQICSPYFTSLGSAPTGLPLLLNSGLPPSASVPPGADSAGGVQYATSDTNEHAFSAPPGEGLWEGSRGPGWKLESFCKFGPRMETGSCVPGPNFLTVALCSFIWLCTLILVTGPLRKYVVSEGGIFGVLMREDWGQCCGPCCQLLLSYFLLLGGYH